MQFIGDPKINNDCLLIFSGQDVNSPQLFEMDVNVSSFKILFNDAYDFFGRITIYNLDISF
jgi:hypothetical protein